MKKVKVFAVSLIGNGLVCKYKKGGFIVRLSSTSLKRFKGILFPKFVSIYPDMDVIDVEFLPGLNSTDKRKIRGMLNI